MLFSWARMFCSDLLELHLILLGAGRLYVATTQLHMTPWFWRLAALYHHYIQLISPYLMRDKVKKPHDCIHRSVFSWKNNAKSHETKRNRWKSKWKTFKQLKRMRIYTYFVCASIVYNICGCGTRVNTDWVHLSSVCVFCVSSSRCWAWFNSQFSSVQHRTARAHVKHK